MKNRPLFLFSATALLTLFTASALRAQNLYVGSNSSSVSTNFTSGTNSYSATYIGVDVGANSNSLSVENTDTVLTNSGVLRVGESGSGNRMVISNGGKVQNILGEIGRASTASNNSVVVTGTGSLWSNSSTFDVGINGAGNSMVISNGGMVQNGSGNIGANASSLNNSVLVTGAGSAWSNTDRLTVGRNGSGTLTVSDGGNVAATNILIGRNTSSAGTLNIGRFGTNDSAGTISAPTIAFGDSTNERAINFNQSNSTTVSAAISGNGTVNQLGSGTTILSASNTYTGTTTVVAGKLAVDGSIAGSTVTVNNGGTLAGSGSVGGIVLNLGGTISPGNSPGTMNVLSNAVWNAGANYNWQIFNASGIKGTTNGWDWLNVSGSLDLTALSVGNEFNINLWSLSGVAPADTNGNALNFDPNQNYTWTILTAAGGISGFTSSSQFDINIGAFNGTGGFANALNGGSFSIAQSLDGKDLNLVFTAAGGAPIPEPGTWAAAALLAGGAAFMRWRKRAKVV